MAHTHDIWISPAHKVTSVFTHTVVRMQTQQPRLSFFESYQITSCTAIIFWQIYIGCYSNDVGVTAVPKDFLPPLAAESWQYGDSWQKAGNLLIYTMVLHHKTDLMLQWKTSSPALQKKTSHMQAGSKINFATPANELWKWGCILQYFLLKKYICSYYPAMWQIHASRIIYGMSHFWRKTSYGNISTEEKAFCM